MGIIEIEEMQYEEDEHLTYRVTSDDNSIYDDEEFDSIVEAETFADEWSISSGLAADSNPIEISRNYTKPSWAAR